MIPIVAIVGRPNVGKSTLFNRLHGARVAIVHDEPGVTRDRHYADVELYSRTFTLIDTGGFDPADDDAIGRGIARHVRAAIDEADVVLCVLDGLYPPTAADQAAVRLLRQSEKPAIYLANRIDTRDQMPQMTELCSLGIDPIAISALHGRGFDHLGEALRRALPAMPEPEAEPPADWDPELDTEGEGEGDAEAAAEAEAAAVPHVALIGRPNAGKSSLLNRLSGDERSLVDDRPGTTRDPVDVRLTHKGQEYVVVDTAGIRRRSKVEQGVESASVMQALRSVARGDVVIVMCDAKEGLAEQDARLLGLCADRGRAIVVGLNKVDLLGSAERKKARESAIRQLHFAPWVPLVELSTKSGEGVAALMQRVRRSYQQYRRRIPTADLNRFLQDVVERQPPPRVGNRAPRLFFMTQARAAPPVFVVMCSSADAVKESYQRFLTNLIRKTFSFDSVPIAVRFRNRRRRQDPA